MIKIQFKHCSSRMSLPFVYLFSIDLIRLDVIECCRTDSLRLRWKLNSMRILNLYWFSSQNLSKTHLNSSVIFIVLELGTRRLFETLTCTKCEFDSWFLSTAEILTLFFEDDEISVRVFASRSECFLDGASSKSS